MASLSKLSPSRTAATRVDTPTLFTIEVATASVGLTIAPNAIPHPSPRPGISQAKNGPRIRALATTSTTDRPLMPMNSRRRSIAGIDTAAEYSNGGSTPMRIHSGSMWTAGTNGSELAPMPITTSSSGAATPKRAMVGSVAASARGVAAVGIAAHLPGARCSKSGLRLRRRVVAGSKSAPPPAKHVVHGRSTRQTP